MTVNVIMESSVYTCVYELCCCYNLSASADVVGVYAVLGFEDTAACCVAVVDEFVT